MDPYGDWSLKILRRYVLVEDDQGVVRAKIRRDDPGLERVRAFAVDYWGERMDSSGGLTGFCGMQLMAVILACRTLKVRGV